MVVKSLESKVKNRNNQTGNQTLRLSVSLYSNQFDMIRGKLETWLRQKVGLSR